MNWFKPKQGEELKKLLKNSKSDFRFDLTPGRHRLMSSIEVTSQNPAKHFRFSKVLTYSMVFASLVLAVSGTFAFASTAKPGDNLFSLNKFGEKIVLNLPLSLEQKTQVQEYIVNNRLQALDQVDTGVDKINKQVNTKLEARTLVTVKESDESLMSAINDISKSKKALEASGKTAAAQKLEEALDRLQAMAEKREAAIQNLEDKTSNIQTKTQLQAHLKQIQDSRLKAQLQIKRFNNK